MDVKEYNNIKFFTELIEIILALFIKILVPISSWSGGLGKQPCKGMGTKLMSVGDAWGTQILNLKECQRSCDEQSGCNSISWRSGHNYCWLWNKDDVCDDTRCDWIAGHYHYEKNCGNYF